MRPTILILRRDGPIAFVGSVGVAAVAAMVESAMGVMETRG